jgi:hypothetical protein
VIDQEKKRVADFTATLAKMRDQLRMMNSGSPHWEGDPGEGSSRSIGALKPPSPGARALIASCRRCATYQLARNRASSVCEPRRGVMNRLSQSCSGDSFEAKPCSAPSSRQALMRPSFSAAASPSGSNNADRLEPTQT